MTPILIAPLQSGKSTPDAYLADLGAQLAAAFDAQESERALRDVPLCRSTRAGAGCGHPALNHRQDAGDPCDCCSGRRAAPLLRPPRIRRPWSRTGRPASW
jgi:hypothetical protein